ncbi:Sulfur carrier protein ThiS [Planctomycetes bacterium Pla163]|uniref:Sulfur carrier protein ThiS n=1 Tax=Rohdeia mirabilis TaxID=2528008 RepID=A0A518CZI5_9BACT|nr:Sulfur carrier protein ThiS [Planctomycetes bacterium Pla163]
MNGRQDEQHGRTDGTFAVRVNGTEREVAVGTTVAQLLDLLELRPELVAVEVNGALVPRTRRTEHVLESGDAVELVTLVGGG